ncbi:alginate lyase family protein [Lacrimispora sp.]|uniref:alginate lyase family protein n=1 Tax=Lacrimispora sp. TaxID=2719234 RepID=UPI0028A258EA|nr:alginate lyase family protein [Lacrimispora sp.]
MITYPKSYSIPPGLDDSSKYRILQKAEFALTAPIPHITDAVCPRSPGTIHDYCSNGDYWWPDPDSADGLPYIRRDGESNPGNFNKHRMILRRMRTCAVNLAYAYVMTREERFAQRSVLILKEFFLDEATNMNPNLSYAQAIPGICTGRGIGIIDTIHLADIPFVIQALCGSPAMTDFIYQGLKKWFSRYLGWMLTDENGIEEMNTDNNHSVCFFMQAAVFSLFTDNEVIAGFCREHFKNVLLKQMNTDGSFPRELARTKPYNYSIFIVDNLVTICHVLSTPEDVLWNYEDSEGRSIRKAIDFLFPYVIDKSRWPYSQDIAHFDAFPARASFLLFAGCRMGIPELIRLYESLPFESEDEEARRNAAIRQPLLWM